MATEHQRLTSAERSNLVAYLDGELDELQAQSIAAKLTRSVSARHEVEMLVATWDLLETLPRPEPSAEFKTRTVSMAIASPAMEERWLEAARGSAQRLSRFLIAAVSALVMIGVGYGASRWLLPDLTARLARDLSIAENLEPYRAVGDLEFVRMLDNSTLLGETELRPQRPRPDNRPRP
ncbi:hypothetical protein BH23PLA1_BH23PLA1_33330 [soil metagenome]